MRFITQVLSGLALLPLASGCADIPPETLEEPIGEVAAPLATTDERFGFYGVGAQTFAHTFGSNSYINIGNQNDPARPRVIQALEPAMDPLPGEKVVVRVGLFNARLDGYGYGLDTFAASVRSFAKRRAEFYAYGFTKPTYRWFQPDVVMVHNIEKDQITTAIRRWRSKGIRLSDITFEIGNEPNYYVSMTPREYAYLYKQYHWTIKSEAPEVKVALGSLFAFELMPADARDQIGQLITLAGMKEYDSAVNSGLGKLSEPVVFLSTLGTSAVFGLGAEFWLWLTSAGERGIRDARNLLTSRFFAKTSTQYVSEVLDQLPADIAPDVISFHAYPADFKNHYGYDQIDAITDKLADDLRTLAYDKRRNVYPPAECTSDYCTRTGPEIFITEMGNINPYVSEGELALRLYYTVGHLKESSTVDRWFWYKTVGQDAQFELLKNATGVEPPFTRLTINPAYVAPKLPGRVPCAELNYTGGLYYYLATETFCE